jgi:hypothetical protein
MREVDRVVMEDFGLTILQMMENAGRNLAQHRLEMLRGQKGQITILAGHLYLPDIGIPPEVFHRVGLHLDMPFATGYHTRLEPVDRM